MSRSGYSDECEGNALELYRQTVENAIKGKRGQKALRDMLAAMDAMPVKELHADLLVSSTGESCALGTIAGQRCDRPEWLDPEDRYAVADALGLAPAFVAEVAYMNDEGSYEPETPAERWTRMRNWIQSNIKEVPQ